VKRGKEQASENRHLYLEEREERRDERRASWRQNTAALLIITYYV
jgi:hypothetical protein